MVHWNKQLLWLLYRELVCVQVRIYIMFENEFSYIYSFTSVFSFNTLCIYILIE